MDRPARRQHAAIISAEDYEAAQRVLESNQSECFEHLALPDDVTVEAQIDDAPVQRDGFPLGEGCFAALVVAAAPAPDSQERYAAQTSTYRGVSFPGSFGDNEDVRRIDPPVGGLTSILIKRNPCF
jgi:hypothetical protein